MRKNIFILSIIVVATILFTSCGNTSKSTAIENETIEETSKFPKWVDLEIEENGDHAVVRNTVNGLEWVVNTENPFLVCSGNTTDSTYMVSVELKNGELAYQIEASPLQ